MDATVIVYPVTVACSVCKLMNEQPRSYSIRPLCRMCTAMYGEFLCPHEATLVGYALLVLALTDGGADGDAALDAVPCGTYYAGGGWFADLAEGKNGRVLACGRVVRMAADGAVYEWWQIGSQAHRQDAPAVRVWYADGTPKVERWAYLDCLWRPDGPAYQEWAPSGQLTARMWATTPAMLPFSGGPDGLHRDDGPAHEGWHLNGMPSCADWYRRGALHNDNGPAAQRWGEGGALTCEIWARDGRTHRVGGPARMHSRYGFVRREWWEDGRLLRVEKRPIE